MDEREKNLPKWAQELIADLRKRILCCREDLTKELATLRPENARLKATNEAYHELLDCAARGKHTTAQVIIETLQGYSLTLTKDE